jgi:P4 family phage/plasmid primase-like protien
MNDKSKWSNLEDFLSAHVLDKNSNHILTHTTYGKYCAKYHIPHDKHNEFLNLYYKHIIKTGKTHNIIERQLIEKNQSPAPVLVDVDLRFSEQHVDRMYTEDDVFRFVQLYLRKIESCFEMDEETKFQVFILQKPAPRLDVKPTGNVVKDGLHMIFSIAIEQVYHLYLRDQVVEEIETIWSHLPIINNGGWDDVLDNSISSGTNGWLLLNSKKKDDLTHYSLTTIYDVSYDSDDQKIVICKNTENIDQFLSKHHKLLSARYTDRPTLLTKSEMLPIIKQYEHQKSKPEQAKVQSSKTFELQEIQELGYRIPMQTIRCIQTREDMDIILGKFLDALNNDSKQYELREAYEYAMILPEQYYCDGSYNKWIRVAFALNSISIYSLIIWIAFSARSPTFSFTSIPTLCDKWAKIPHMEMGGITEQSLLYWAKMDAPDLYHRTRESTLSYFLDSTIDAATLDNIGKKGGKGTNDNDIAGVLHQMKKDEFVASSFKLNEWYKFKGNRWVKNDCGVDLRKTISSDLRDLYRCKAHAVFEKYMGIPPENEEKAEEKAMLKAKADKILNIALMLGNTKDKENIMKEAREKFYDEDFLRKLDQNKYLLCFNNGVIDFKTKTFRQGCPEDYISKSTGIDYIPLDRERDKFIIDEIEDYMNKLFPEKELCEYMWDHLCSVLIGDTGLNQCLHYYTGFGQNGKSILVKLMQMVLGEYAVELDVKFFTQERTKLGGTSSELFNTIGARYAITAEPSQGEKLNEGPMKQITSGTDKMSCRPLYGQQIEFMPQVNCVIMANHFLEVRTTDWGTWRRIRPVEFKSLFTDNPVDNDPNRPYQFKKVPSFDDKFKLWAPVFMAMLVDRAFKTNGIVKECSIVEKARNNYRIDQDIVAEYVRERLMLNENSTTGINKTDLVSDFNSWYSECYQGKVNKTKELCNYMDRTYIPKKNKNGTGTVIGWLNVSYVTDNNTNAAKYVISDDASTTGSELSS